MLFERLRALAGRFVHSRRTERDAELEQAWELFEHATDEEFSSDPRSLGELLEAGDRVLRQRYTEGVARVLDELVGWRYQYGYYSHPQVERVHAFIERVFGEYADAASLHELARGVPGSFVGGQASTILELIAERLVDLGDHTGAMGLMQRLTDMAGENPEGWNWVRSVDPRWRIENRIRERKGLEPLPRPERPMRPRQPPDPEWEARSSQRHRLEQELRPLLDALEHHDAMATLPADRKAAVEAALDGYVAERTVEELRVLAEVARYGYSRGGFVGAARLALLLNERGLTDEAREIQRWLASNANCSDNPNNARRKNEALDVLEPVLGALPRKFPLYRWGDADHELHTIEERAFEWNERGYACRFDAARRRLARHEWERAFAHVVRALSLTWRNPEERPADADEVTRAVLAARQPLDGWTKELLRKVRREDGDNDGPDSLRHADAFLLLGWIGVEQARRGEREAARTLRHTLAALVPESWDDIELNCMNDARRDAVARIDAALG